jgi:hypothetical protein
MMVGYGCESESQEGEELDLYLTLHYELVMRDDAPEPGSKADQELIVGYRALARRLCEETVNLVRGWKKRGRLETLAKEEEKKIA